MKVAEVKQALIDGVGSHMEGYTLKRSDFNYVRNAGELRYIFHIEIHSKFGAFTVQSAVRIGAPKIGKLCGLSLNEKAYGSDGVVGFGIWNKHDGRGTYYLDDVADVEQVAKSLCADFDEIAVPEFAKYNSLQDLECELNKLGDDGEQVYRGVSEACYALVAAQLCGRGDLERLSATYYEMNHEPEYPEIAEPILRVRDYLLS